MAVRPSSARNRIARLRFPLRGRRVDLVPPALDQIPAVVRLMNEPSVARSTLHVPYPYTSRNGRDWVRKAKAGRRSGRWLGLTVVRRSDAEILGGVGLHNLGGGSTSAEAGYWLGREHRGQGYATEAVNLLVRTGFTRLGLHRIEARVFPTNAASRGVVRRCGFRYEGRLRDEVQKDGHWRATLLFARLETDPPPRR
ncbi:MAG TPA: GNAT family N-acetyltransferase [Thermoplasmata archaeon]